MIEISNLKVMHNDLRHLDNLNEMVNFVQMGGIWNEKSLLAYQFNHKLPKASPLIQLSCFEDKKIYVHDGHHRVVSTLMAGRNFLHQEEYQLTHWKYDDYLFLNHSSGWYTPFDPRTHTRTPDFSNFKKIARQKYMDNPEEARQWIFENMNSFAVLREIDTALELKQRVSNAR